MAKKSYPGGFRLTLATARRLAVQEFGTAKGLEPDRGTYLEGFFTMKMGNMGVSISPDLGMSGCIMVRAGLCTASHTCIGYFNRETLEPDYDVMDSGMDFTAMMEEGGGKIQGGPGQASVSQRITSMLAKVEANDLGSLKEYFDSGESGVEQYTKAIEYTYNVSPQIFLLEDGNPRQVNPDQSFAAIGIGSASGSNNFMSMMMNTDVFHPMPEDTSLFQKQYEVKAGRWPERYNECVVVLTSGGSISDLMLYAMGLRDSLELDEMIRQFIAEEDIKAPTDLRPYDYEELLDVTFKLVNAADYYAYDDTYGVWKDKSGDEAYMRELASQGEDLTIVGVVQPLEDAMATMLDAGIGYPASLTKHVIEQAAASAIVQEQLDAPNTNVLTGDAFGADEEQGGFDMESLFTINEDTLQNAFSIDQSKLTVDMSRYFNTDSLDPAAMIDPDQLTLDLPELDGAGMGDVLGQLDLSASPEKLQQLAQSITDGYYAYAQIHPWDEDSDLSEHFAAYLQTPEAQMLLTAGIAEIIDVESLEAQISNAVGGYMQMVTGSYTEAVTQAMQLQIAAVTQQIVSQMGSQMERAMQQAMDEVAANMEDAFIIDADAFASAIEMSMSEEELTELLRSMMTAEDASFDGNLKSFGYADLNKPAQINIYPLDFESKESIAEILGAYNSRMTGSGQEEKVISYTDLVGTMMSSVTEIVNTISYVLVAFVAISLVVSSIMIGVITYISVLERKKEIGILRAIGASKGNISQVFNAETFIVGLCAGLIGIGMTLLLLIPGNALIHSLAGSADVNAVLPAANAVVLILLSVVLTLIGGLIPSRKAAKSDPVAALRAE